jgi:hypothetical protein
MLPEEFKDWEGRLITRASRRKKGEAQAKVCKARFFRYDDGS